MLLAEWVADDPLRVAVAECELVVATGTAGERLFSFALPPKALGAPDGLLCVKYQPAAMPPAMQTMSTMEQHHTQRERPAREYSFRNALPSPRPC